MHKIGVVPFKLKNDAVDLMFITSQTRQRWVLPKGNPERNETPEDVCHREAFEEAGIKGTILSRFPITTVITRKQNGDIEKLPVTYYPMLVDHEAKKWPEHRERKRRWVPYSRFKKLVRDDDVRKIVRNFDDLLPWVKQQARFIEARQSKKLKLVK